jgi:hypothetical protein
MASNRTEKSRFQSQFAPPGETLYVSDAAMLAEVMCRRMEARDHVKLEPKFWNTNPIYKKEFLKQVSHANKLLSQYNIEVILAALKHPRAYSVYSLGLKSVLVPLIEAEIAKSELTASEAGPILKVEDATTPPRQPLGSKTVLSKLKDL